VALPAQAFAGSNYFCQMTGRVSESCCCAGKRVRQTCHAEIKAQDCCELVQTHAPAPAPATRASLAEVPAAALIGVVPSVLNARAHVARHVETERVDTHPPGPPRFLAHCSFLI
jgi:hypothetical protein